MSTPCAACGFAKTREFYTVENVPTQSNLLVSSREEALNFPRGDVALSMCERCGFIFNTRFDPTLLESSERYEATQGFSPTFGKYADALAARWVEQFDLRGKAVLEIGCGDGEFLERMVSAGAGRAVGFDPVAKPQAAGRAGVEIRREFYGDSSQNFDTLGVDFVICRHTLEHISAVAEFLNMLRRKIGRRDVRLGFEVPDTARVLGEGAFWDIYYEHCSYFTADSLRGAFARAGFGVLDLRAEFGGQYLVLEAAPASGTAAQPAAELPDLNHFGVAAGSMACLWVDVLQRLERVALWGAGSKAAGFLNTLQVGEGVPCVVDVNPRKAGSFIPGTGQPVVLPEQLGAFAPDAVIAMNPIYQAEVGRDLKRLGLSCKLTTL